MQLDLLFVFFSRLLQGFLLAFGDEHRSIRPVPCGNLVTPPELPGYAPRLDLAHPVEKAVLPLAWHEPLAPVLDRPKRRGGQHLGVAVPLVGEPGLDHHARAIVMRHHQRVILDLFEEPGGREVRNHLFARRKPVETAVARRHRIGKPGILIENVDQRETVPPADFEIVKIVSGCDLDRTAPGLRIGMLVGDNRNEAIG